MRWLILLENLPPDTSQAKLKNSILIFVLTLPLYIQISNFFDIFREFAVMFAQADKNEDGQIDFEEFSAMMIPSTNQ